MGSRGPVPKRDAERIRTNSESRADHVTRYGRVAAPAADKEWHKRAIAWYRSLRRSGQSDFYEPSDWAQAWVLADVLSKLLKSDQMSAELFKNWLAGARDLHTTEGSRRRSHIEIDRPTGEEEPEEGSLPALAVVPDVAV